MNIYNELYQIAAAKYGLQLKDPIFAAFDKLSREERFELKNDFLNNDEELLNEALTKYFNDNTTTKTLKNFIDAFMTLNSRKGYYAKHGNGHGEYDESNVAKWIDMLGRELIKSSSGKAENEIHDRGNGIVSGSRIRAAIYYLLEILNYNASVTNTNPNARYTTSCCVLGQDINLVEVEGTEEGLGVYISSSEQSGYRFYIVLTNLFTGRMIILPVWLGENKLYKGEFKNVAVLPWDAQDIPYSLYKVSIKEDIVHGEEIETNVQLTYNAIKEALLPKPEDFTYTTHYSGTAATISSYNGSDTKVMIPDTFGVAYLDIIASGCFTGTSVKNVYIPDGVTEIE